jgi:hypothetical protein
VPQTVQDNNVSPDLWAGLPQVNQRAVVHWLAVITVKATIVAEPTPSTGPGTGERSCPP